MSDITRRGDARIECPIPENYDIDDQAPLLKKQRATYETKVTMEPLLGGIQFFKTEFFEFYRKTDDEALKFQRQHKKIAKIAISLGFAAIFFAIIQFCLLSLKFPLHLPYGNWEVVDIFRAGEVVAGIFAAVAVVAGLYRADQNRWLINRHIAECYRLLKFRSLLDKNFWDIHEFEQWKRLTNEKIQSLNEIYENENNEYSIRNLGTALFSKMRTTVRREKEKPGVIEEWINADKITPSPASNKCSYSPAAKKEFLDYYRKKRLIYQMNYYLCRYRDLKTTYEQKKKLPKVLFITSVAAVLLHFIIDLFSISAIISIGLIGVAVTVPIAGYVVKTYHDTFQAARSSALYYAKYSALDNLNNQLSEYENALDENWKQILDTLWECENFLEAEHREWLILIQDAEWFL